MQETWSRTYSGGVFHPINPCAEEVFFADIICTLPKICRYNGGIRDHLHYSVAEHSVLLTRYLRQHYSEDPVLLMQVLLHDAAEAYVCDLIHPVKRCLPQFSAIEDRILLVIFEKIGIPFPLPDIVLQVDRRICLDEEAQALTPARRKFDIPGGPLGVTLEFWDSARAREEFHSEFLTISAELNRAAAE